MIRHELSWMDDRVHANTIRGLRDAWRDGVPAWVGLDHAAAMEGDALQVRLSSLLDGVEGADIDALRERLTERSAGQPLAADGIELRLARRTGTDMLAALCVASELTGMVPGNAFLPVVRGPARRANLVIALDGGNVRLTVPLSPEASWSDGALTVARVLPNTLQIATLDKPLSSLVSHALLDPLALTITDFEIVKGRETRIATSHRRDPVAIAALDHADLASDETALDTPPPSRRRKGGDDMVSPF